MHYLYRITNITNNMTYIGQTVNTTKRWQAHKSYVKNPCQYIHRAMAKYGIENFVYEVIATSRSQEDADFAEDLLIQQYDSQNPEKGYNLCRGGNTGWIGKKHSAEAKAKMSAAKVGKPSNWKGKSPSAEARAKMSAAKKGVPSNRKGMKHSAETLKKLSAAHTGIKQSAETIAKRFSPETRAKMSESAKKRCQRSLANKETV